MLEIVESNRDVPTIGQALPIAKTLSARLKKRWPEGAPRLVSDPEAANSGAYAALNRGTHAMNKLRPVKVARSDYGTLSVEFEKRDAELDRDCAFFTAAGALKHGSVSVALRS
jgi:hypothetical protein